MLYSFPSDDYLSHSPRYSLHYVLAILDYTLSSFLHASSPVSVLSHPYHTPTLFCAASSYTRSQPAYTFSRVLVPVGSLVLLVSFWIS